jgi:hypothetical protein
MQATASISLQLRSLGALVAAGCWLLAERAQVRAPLFPGTGCGAPVIPVSHGLGDRMTTTAALMSVGAYRMRPMFPDSPYDYVNRSRSVRSRGACQVAGRGYCGRCLWSPARGMCPVAPAS